jgi:hypothetical protein
MSKVDIQDITYFVTPTALVRHHIILGNLRIEQASGINKQ